MNFRYNIFKIGTERYIYFSIWLLAVLYSLSCFAKSSHLYFQYYKDKYDDFTDGFQYIKSRRDKSDLEWETIYYLIKQFFPWIFLYIIVSEIIKNLPLSIEAFQLWQVCFTIVYVLVHIGYLTFCLILLQPIIFYLICNFYRSTIVTWLCTGITLVFITFYKQINADEEFVEFIKLNPQELYLIVLSLFWMNLKCTSYFLEKQRSSTNPLDFLSYCLYPPTILTGPYIPLRDYLNIYKPTTLSFQERVKKLILNLSICLFWFLFTNFCLHYIYVNATSYQTQLVQKFDSWSLYGYGYAMGQFFHIKYVILYGLTTSFASFENVNVPRLPRCIGRIHLYSDMWKYFDTGLYKFLLRYIYIPLCQLCNYKLIASFGCFLFVYLWHGVEHYILVWTALNYVGIVSEYVSKYIYKKYFEKHYAEKMNPCWLRRIKCIMASPLLVVSAISNFYFFAGSDIGNIFINRIFQDNFTTNTILLFVLYCCCEVSTDLRDTNARKM